MRFKPEVKIIGLSTIRKKHKTLFILIFNWFVHHVFVYGEGIGGEIWKIVYMFDQTTSNFDTSNTKYKNTKLIELIKMSIKFLSICISDKIRSNFE